MSNSIDVDKPGNYPIVLSDALLMRGTKEVYTGIRYNSKPPTIPSNAQLKPSDSNPSKFNLTFSDKADGPEYEGARKSCDGQYILIFDPAKKHFVLHQVDSEFDMSVVKMPAARGRKPSTQATKASAKTAAGKVEKPKRGKAKAREPTPDAEDEDSDDGLTIEYPGGPPPKMQTYRPSPVVPLNRNAYGSRQEEEEASEEESEQEEFNRDVEALKLPSPYNPVAALPEAEADEDMDIDLEAELEKEFMKNDNESSESEEE